MHWVLLPLVLTTIDAPDAKPPGMVLVQAGTFTMGSDDAASRPDERPAHQVHVDAFWIDETEVTNAQFAAFVDATGYITTAEKPIDWEDVRAQVPPGTPKPPDEDLAPGSMVFTIPPDGAPVDQRVVSSWWSWVHGAHWRQPEGPGSSIKNRMDHPVVHVSWDDAMAYAAWAGKHLPTEAQWERAARFGRNGMAFTWGQELTPDDTHMANLWQGRFPTSNTSEDGHLTTAPVKTFPPNALGLYDMAGNVWEWTADRYRADTHAIRAQASPTPRNPEGPAKSHDPRHPHAPVTRVQKGGSFLCHASYCSSYRPSARMSTTPDSSLSHTGFRCVGPAPDPPAPPATTDPGP